MHPCDRLAWLSALFLALSACDAVEPIPVGVCGNGVLEAGEDCDLFATHGPETACGQPDEVVALQRCRYLCDYDGDDGEAARCPGGWACGPDDVCHFAVGEYAQIEGSPFALLAGEHLVGDVDGDAIPDIIGFSQTSVRVLYGAGNGQFPTAFELATPSLTGLATFGRIDEQRADYHALLPFELGLLQLAGQSDRTLATVASRLELDPLFEAGPQLPPIAEMRIVLLDPSADGGPITTRFVFVLGHPAGVALAAVNVSITDFGGEAPAPPLQVPAAAPRTIDNLTPPAVADIDGGSGMGGEDMALAFRGDDRVLVYGLDDADALIPRATVPVGGLGTVGEGGARFVHVDGDNVLDLLISIESGGDELVAVAPGNGDGTFGLAAIDGRFAHAP